MLDLNKPYVLTEALKQVPVDVTFLSDRYAPTNGANDVFATEEIIFDYASEDRIAAPFVIPMSGGVKLNRQGFQTMAYKPGTIDVQMTLTLDDLKKRGFGEVFNNVMTPEQRQDAYTVQDMVTLRKAIQNRRELMVGELLTSNAVKMVHVSNDGKLQNEELVQYYDEDNTSEYVTSNTWDNDDADIYSDLKIMVRALRDKGVAVTDLICGPEVADAILANSGLKEILDNRRMFLGEVNQSVEANGVSIVAQLVIDGSLINVFCYNATFTDLTDGTLKRAIPEGYAVLTAPNSCKTKYGAVNLLLEDKMFHTFAEPYVSEVVADMGSNVRSLHMYSNPLVHPAQPLSFMYSKVL